MTVKFTYTSDSGRSADTLELYKVNNSKYVGVVMVNKFLMFIRQPSLHYKNSLQMLLSHHLRMINKLNS